MLTDLRTSRHRSAFYWYWRFPSTLPEWVSSARRAGRVGRFMVGASCWWVGLLAGFLLLSGLQAPCVTNRQDYLVGNGPFGVAVGDVNGDGKPINPALRLGQQRYPQGRGYPRFMHECSPVN